VLCTPPNKTGQIDPAILYTAHLIGIHKVVKLGGIQAISAMTFGIGGVPGVDKIFGPGNQYVTAAKQLAARFGVAIDMPAGPSEVAVLADDLSNPAYIAADLLSQAEHGPDSQVILVGSSKKIVDKIVYELNQQLDKLPRKKVAYKAMQNSRAFVFGRTRDMIDITNAYAPEHLIICTTNYEEISANIVNAGSVFLGPYTTESAGDYASGTNHTLPTNGWARAYSGVNLDSFTKKITFQYISDEGLKMIGPAIELMAETEQLTAHKNAVTIRLNDLK
jgi:histidinol dehydrogenase